MTPAEIAPGWTIARIEESIARGDMTLFSMIPHWASSNPPEAEAPGWAEKMCHHFMRDESPHVRASAIEGFGRLASTVGQFREPERVQSAVRLGFNNSDPDIRKAAEAAAIELNRHLGWDLAPSPRR